MTRFIVNYESNPDGCTLEGKLEGNVLKIASKILHCNKKIQLRKFSKIIWDFFCKM